MTASGFLKLIFLNSVQISWIYHFPLVLPKVCNGFICWKAIVIQSREVIPFRLIGISKGRCPSTWASRQDGRIRSVLLIINKLIIRRFDGSCLDLSQLRRRMQLFTIGVFKVISLLFNIWLCLMLAGPGLECGSGFLLLGNCFLFRFEWV